MQHVEGDAYNILVIKPKGRDRLGDVEVDGRII
jgi:hypothetical protein